MLLDNNQFKVKTSLSKKSNIMELNYMNNLPLGGFNYDNCLRNKALQANLKPEK